MNFNDLYIDYCKEQTDAPESFHYVLSYLVLASVVNRNVYVQFGYKQLFPNLYILIVAPSSLHRKSWSQGIAVHMIKKARPGYVLMDCSSRESFISELANKERDGCGLLAIDELAGFMSRIKHGQHFSGFIQDLSSAYDGSDIARRKGVSEKEKEMFVIENPCLNMTACCSNDWLNKSVESSDIRGGGFARFLWAYCDEKVKNPWHEPKPHSKAKFDLLLTKLERIKEFVGEAGFSEEAANTYKRWYSQFREKNQSGRWDQNYERLTVIAKKLSILNCLARYEEENKAINEPIIIEKRDVGLGCLLAEESASHFGKIVVGDSPEEVMRNKVLLFIQKNPKTTRSKLLQGIWGINAWNLDNILKTLITAEAIHFETVLALNNKQTEIFSVNGQNR